MEKTKKIISIILILILTIVPFSSILDVDAESITVKGTNDEGIREDLIINETTITVNNILESDLFDAYKILDSFYNENTNEVSYEFTSEFSTFLNTDSIKASYPDFSVESYIALTSDYVTADGIPSADDSVVTTSTLNALLSKYAAYVKVNSIAGIGMTTSGTSASVTVSAGSYLILSNKSNGVYIYGVMVANAVPVVENGEWVINHAIISAKKSTNDGDYQFLFADCSLDFFAENALKISTGEISVDIYTDSAAFSLGKEFLVDFISELPSFPSNAVNKLWKTELIYPKSLDINWTDGFSIIGANTVVKFSDNKVVDLDGNQIATIVEDEIEQTENGEIVKYNRLTIIVDYSVYQEDNLQLAFGFSLNENAVVGGLGNIIRKVVTYTDDPYVVGSVKSYESTLTAYTYGIEVKSYGEKLEDDTYPLLMGGEYDVYADEDLSSLIGSIVIDENGVGMLKGVTSGTYYLKQTKTSTGYQLVKEPIKIEVANENAVDEDNDGFYEKSIYNEKLWFLPSTGGIGTLIYTIVGLCIVLISGLGVVYYRKKAINMN